MRKHRNIGTYKYPVFAREICWTFIGEIKNRAESGKPNPPELETTIRTFATQFKTDITPIRNFQRDFNDSEVGAMKTSTTMRTSPLGNSDSVVREEATRKRMSGASRGLEVRLDD
jgi:hypothetical protein